MRTGGNVTGGGGVGGVKGPVAFSKQCTDLLECGGPSRVPLPLPRPGGSPLRAWKPMSTLLCSACGASAGSMTMCLKPHVAPRPHP